jgi:hypothetical protein
MAWLRKQCALSRAPCANVADVDVGADPVSGQGRKYRVALDADVPTSVPQGGYAYAPRAAEWVQNDVSWLRAGNDDRAQHADRLLCRVLNLPRLAMAE